MVDIKALLEQRRRTKKKMPVFSRKDCNRKKRIEDDVWRKARGVDNKQRLNRKGYKKGPSSGYQAPILVRGLHKSGLIPMMVSSPDQLNNLSKEHGIIISSQTGDRKRKIIILEAQKRNLRILNLDAEKRTQKIETELIERKEHRKKSLEAKEKKSIDEKVKKETKKDKDKEEKKPDQSSDEEKKKLEKDEKDKILTKPE
ncbi:MAG: eL32 family ribosomal protein [archaeon]